MATAATQSVERPILPTVDQKAKGRSISDTKATLKHQQNVLKLQQVIQYSFHLNFPSLSKWICLWSTNILKTLFCFVFKQKASATVASYSATTTAPTTTSTSKDFRFGSETFESSSE